jgi:hypothetical protein
MSYASEGEDLDHGLGLTDLASLRAVAGTAWSEIWQGLGRIVTRRLRA